VTICKIKTSFFVTEKCLKSRNFFFHVKTDPKGHVTHLRLKMDVIMSHDGFKCQMLFNETRAIVFQFKVILLKTRDPLYSVNSIIFTSKPRKNVKSHVTFLTVARRFSIIEYMYFKRSCDPFFNVKPESGRSRDFK